MDKGIEDNIVHSNTLLSQMILNLKLEIDDLKQKHTNDLNILNDKHNVLKQNFYEQCEDKNNLQKSYDEKVQEIADLNDKITMYNCLLKEKGDKITELNSQMKMLKEMLIEAYRG
jgi:chromosome segregation ATPase